MRSLPSGAGYGASGFLSCVGIKRPLPNYPTLSGRPCSMPLLLRPNKKETGKSRAKESQCNSKPRRKHMGTIDRYLAYAAAFEEVYASDDWAKLEPLITADGVYKLIA